MKLDTTLPIIAALSVLSACDRYTDQTSPCFGRDGEPAVTRASLSFSTKTGGQARTPKDCVFETLPRPE